ncbi:hypothetical protein Acr_12g0009930 [Actinidia rufa]|uniref:Uncharacterized protein n=1 Tax=Actinidia rufa TaxID=165716 RepID=A0A7J0FIE1_9ERIC|nr:hypothetical protein Acr_12g0009930 [Actinidia rufa]
MISTEKPFLSFLGIPDSSARITPCGKPRMKDTEGDEQEDDWADQTMHWTRGTTVAEQTSEFQRATGRGQKEEAREEVKEEIPTDDGRRAESRGRTLSAFIATRRDKKNCPRNKAQDQSSKAATTAMMVVDESDVLLAASADEESDWISDSGIAYHLCRDREMFSTHDAIVVGKRQSASEGTLRVSKGNRRSYRRRKTGRLYRLRENVQTGELLSDIGPVDPQWNRSAKEMLWDTCGSLARHEKVQPVQDVHEEAQRKETESMHNDRRDVAETSLFRSRSVAVISPVVHTREERWSHDDLQSDVLCSAPRRAGPEVIGMDNLKNSEDERKEGRKKEEEKRRERCSDSSVRDSCCDCEEVQDGGHLSSPKSQMVGMYELMAELIFSALRPIN